MVRQFKSIQFRHADIHQNHGNIGLQQNLQRCLGRCGFNQVLAEFPEHDLVTEQLCRLIIHHQDIDLCRPSPMISFCIHLTVQPHTKRRKQLLGVHRFRQVL